ncbi:MAG: hypothetical protein HY000_07100, partial [Planctomycetes bacterium]|nr:hypothetical protein [Planctomycetota bacterium]
PQRYAKPGEPVYDPQRYADRYQRASNSLRKPPVHLLPPHQSFLADELFRRLVQDGQRAFVLSVDAAHVHVLAEFEPAGVKRHVGAYKGRLSNHLGKAFPDLAGQVWCNGCHALPKRTSEAIRAAADYVRSHAAEGALVREYRRTDAQPQASDACR